MKKYILFTILFLTLFIYKTDKVFAISKLDFDVISDNKESTNLYLINLNIDTGSDYINAIEGKLLYPSEILEIKEIRDGNSGINFWLEKPKIEKDGIISFSGITPGGFLGKKIVFSILINKKSNLKGEIKLDKLSIYKNSENGEQVKFSTNSLALPFISIIKKDSIAIDLSSDKNPPQDFTPSILKDTDNQINGKNILVFGTQDKETGIDHYEVREGYFSSYKNAESPYPLEQSILYKKIYVKAIDKANNERVVEFYPSTLVKLYHQYGIIVIIILVILIIKRRKWLNFIA